MEIKVVIDDRLVEGWRRLRALATRRRIAAALALLVLASTVFALAAPLAKPHTFVAGTPARASEINANFDALFTAFNERVIRADRTIAITTAAGCAGLLAELEALDDFRIASTAIVTIELAAGAYTCPRAIEIAHPNANRLVIIGTGAAMADVTLTFPANQNGIHLEYGVTLRRLERMTLQGAGSSGIGILVARNSHISLAAIEIKEFGRGLHASYASNVVAAGLTIRDSVNEGLRSSVGSVVALNGTTSTSNGGAGYVADENSSIRMTNPTATNNGGYGIQALNGSYISYTGATTTGNTSGATSPAPGTQNAAEGTLIDSD